jgi:hypothetical protein
MRRFLSTAGILRLTPAAYGYLERHHVGFEGGPRHLPDEPCRFDRHMEAAMSRIGRLVVLGIAFAVATVTPAMAQAPPPALTGELLAADDAAVPTVAKCGPDRATISYMATGEALAGPYPGPFTETGIVTLGPVTGTFGERPVLKFRAEFTIDSPLGQVTGRKKLAKPADFPAVAGQCFGEHSHTASLTATYRAFITTGVDHCRTEGTASMGLIRGGTSTGVAEDFLTGTPPICGANEDDDDAQDD